MKRYNPYKRLPYSCAWCHSNNTHIIDRPNIDPRESSKYNDEFYIKRDPKRDKHHQIDDRSYSYDNQDNEYLNDRDRIPRLPSDERDERDERDNIPLSNHFIIDCYDCAKYSEVNIQKCMNCSKAKINTKRISNFINVDNDFNIRPSNFLCSDCEYIHYRPTPVCNHNYVKYSGEIFSIGAVFTLRCTHCGAEKTSYPNNDNPHEPYNDNYPNGGGY